MVLYGHASPAELNLNVSWDGCLPKGKIDFIIVSSSLKRPFLAAFKYTDFGLEMVYSEHPHPALISELVSTSHASINEQFSEFNRQYICDLKHCWF